MKYLSLFFVLFFSAGCYDGDGYDAFIADSTKNADSIFHADSIAAVPSQRTLMPRVGDSQQTDTMVIADSTFNSTFRFYFTSTYCGGARPTEEILQEKSTPKPLTNSTTTIVSHL